MPQASAAIEPLAFTLVNRSLLATCAHPETRPSAENLKVLDACITKSLKRAFQEAPEEPGAEAWPGIWRCLTYDIVCLASEHLTERVEKCANGVVRYMKQLLPSDDDPLPPQTARSKLGELLLGDIGRCLTTGHDFWAQTNGADVTVPPRIALHIRHSPASLMSAGAGIQLSYHNDHDNAIKVDWHHSSTFDFDGNLPQRGLGDYVRFRAGIRHEVIAHAMASRRLTPRQDGWMSYLALRHEADVLKAWGLRDEHLEALLSGTPTKNMGNDLTKLIGTLASSPGWSDAHKWYDALSLVTNRSSHEYVCPVDGVASVNAYALLHILLKIGLGGRLCRSRRIVYRQDAPDKVCGPLRFAVLRLRKGSLLQAGEWRVLRGALEAAEFELKLLEAHGATA